MRTGPTLWQSLGNLDWRHAVSIAIGTAVPMTALWFLAPSVESIASALGAPRSGAWTTRWFLFVPYPEPFTWRAALAVGLIVAPPVGFLSLWSIARRPGRSPGAGTR